MDILIRTPLSDSSRRPPWRPLCEARLPIRFTFRDCLSAGRFGGDSIFLFLAGQIRSKASARKLGRPLSKRVSIPKHQSSHALLQQHLFSLLSSYSILPQGKSVWPSHPESLVLRCVLKNIIHTVLQSQPKISNSLTAVFQESKANKRSEGLYSSVSGQLLYEAHVRTDPLL